MYTCDASCEISLFSLRRQRLGLSSLVSSSVFLPRLREQKHHLQVFLVSIEISEEIKDLQNMNERLQNVAEAGDIDGLYTLIEENHSILDCLDALQFIDTPLHVAAKNGKADFAMEIATLKPSLARKLNEKGLSPMHLALENGHWSIARALVAVDKEVVRVKGRGRRTPLHEVASTGNESLLKEFLDACPASVEDRTIQLETALHLAVKSSKWKAVGLLLTSIRKQNKIEILSRWDNRGNTVLHVAVAASENQHEFVKKLLWEDFQVNHMNTEGKTPLDILLEQGQQGHKLVRPFRRAGALKSNEIESDKSGFVHARAEIRRIRFSWINFISYFRYKPDRDSPDSVRNALLVVVALIATATYQTGITPPVGKWQHKFKHHHFNFLGLSVQDIQFFFYLFINSLGFYMSLVMMVILTVGFPLQVVLVIALVSMVANYGHSMRSIAPLGHGRIFFLFGYVFPILGTVTCVLGWKLLHYLVKLLGKIATKLLGGKFTRLNHGQDRAADVEHQANQIRDADSSVEKN